MDVQNHKFTVHSLAHANVHIRKLAKMEKYSMIIHAAVNVHQTINFVQLRKHTALIHANVNVRIKNHKVDVQNQQHGAEILAHVFAQQINKCHQMVVEMARFSAN